MVPLNYNQLYYFYKIAEHGSLAEASRAIRISSPALSMQLKELETRLNQQLFDRRGNRLLLTPNGATVFEYARDIFKLGNELIDSLKDIKKVEIGCQDSIPKKISDELLSFLLHENDCKVILREGNADKLLRLQSEQKLDLVITDTAPLETTSPLEKRLLLREPLIVVGHPEFNSLSQLSELIGLPFILPTEDSSLRRKVEQYLRNHDIYLNIIAEVEDGASEVDLAIQGHGLIITFKKNVARLLEIKVLKEVFPLSEVAEEIWLSQGQRKLINPYAASAMRDFRLSA